MASVDVSSSVRNPTGGIAKVRGSPVSPMSPSRKSLSIVNETQLSQPNSGRAQKVSLTPEQSPKSKFSPKGRQNSLLSPNNLSDSTEEDISDADQGGNRPALNFAKREVSASQTRSSYSHLSLMTANSPDRLHPRRPPPDQYDYEVHTDDHERIRNPTCAAVRKLSAGEEIGFRQPFGGNEPNSTGSNSSAASTHINPSSNSDSENGSQPAANTSRLSSANVSLEPLSRRGSYVGDGPADGSSADLASMFRGSATRRHKYYEPARVVLHKSDSGIGSNLRATNNNSDTKQNDGYFGSDIYNAPYSGGSTNSMNTFSSRSASAPPESMIVPPSLVSSLAGSPDDNLTIPIKHIREPKHPIYVPAVLRPTDFDCYNTISGVTHVPSTSQPKLIRQHWAQDRSASSCKSCNQNFTVWRRRHHCRKCGDLFCAQDSRNFIGLDRLLNFNILGTPSRACDSCAEEFAGFCLDAPRLHDGALNSQQPLPAVEQDDPETGGGGDWSTF